MEADVDLEIGHPKLNALHEAALLHAGGAWADSEAAFARAEQSKGYDLLPAENELIARLRATNTLALRQDFAPLVTSMPALALEPPTPGTGTLVVLFERGAAPRIRITFDQQTKARQVDVLREERKVPVQWQVDDEASVPAVLVDSIAPRWSNQLEARVRSNTTLGQTLGLDPFSNLREAMSRPVEWWTPPTDFLVGQRALSPGRHVVTVTTLQGRRARVVDIAAGKQVFVVVPN